MKASTFAVLFGAAFLIGLMVGHKQKAAPRPPRPELHESQQALAQAYFRLGVSRAHSVILKTFLESGGKISHLSPGELYSECVRKDISEAKDTLLKMP